MQQTVPQGMHTSPPLGDVPPSVPALARKGACSQPTHKQHKQYVTTSFLYIAASHSPTKGGGGVKPNEGERSEGVGGGAGGWGMHGFWPNPTS